MGYNVEVVLVVLVFFGLWKILDMMIDEVEAFRAEKRAKEHFKKTEKFRRGIK